MTLSDEGYIRSDSRSVADEDWCQVVELAVTVDIDFGTDENVASHLRVERLLDEGSLAQFSEQLAEQWGSAVAVYFKVEAGQVYRCSAVDLMQEVEADLALGHHWLAADAGGLHAADHLEVLVAPWCCDAGVF